MTTLRDRTQPFHFFGRAQCSDLPHVDNINPIYLGPENVLTHSPCLIIFGGLVSSSHSNDIFYLDLHAIENQKTFMALCKEKHVRFHANCGMVQEFSMNSLPDQLVWKKLEVKGMRPSAREFPCVSYDASKQRLLLFGGYSGVYQSDVWQFDLETLKWKEFHPSGNGPVARCGCSGIANRDQLVVYGGYDGGNYLQDMFSLDLQSMVWKILSSENVPGKKTVLTNNTAISNDLFFICGGYSGGEYVNTLSIYDLHGKQWQVFRDIMPVMRTGGGMSRSIVLRGGTQNLMVHNPHLLLLGSNSSSNSSTVVLHEYDHTTGEVIEYCTPEKEDDFFSLNGVALRVFELDENTAGILFENEIVLIGVEYYKSRSNTISRAFRNLYKPNAFPDVVFYF